MSDEEFEDEADLDEELVEADLDEELVIEEDEVALVDEVVLVVDVAVPVVATPAPDGAAKVATEDEDDDVVDLDEELHPDDVEDPLDVLLKEKTASERLDVDEEDLEEADDDEPGERGSTRIAPRRADEFLCSSCFLVLPLSQLADKKRQLCRDCV
jgi:hypothetical protein